VPFVNVDPSSLSSSGNATPLAAAIAVVSVAASVALQDGAKPYRSGEGDAEGEGLGSRFHSGTAERDGSVPSKRKVAIELPSTISAFCGVPPAPMPQAR
jgi:hypothetical protein